MKKTLIAVAALSAMAASAMAANVTVYGKIDQGLQVQSSKTGNADRTTTWKGTSGISSGSRWGLKGTEEIADGYKVGFVFESGFDGMDGKSGQGSRLFGRDAFLTLGTPFGTLTVGRTGMLSDGCTGDIIAGPASPFGTSYSLAATTKNTFGDILGGRTDRAVRYVSPKFAGVQVHAEYANMTYSETKFVEHKLENGNVVKVEETASKVGATASTKQRYGGIGVSYANGPFYAAVAAETIRQAALNSAKKDPKFFSFAANYDFGVAKVFAGYQYAKDTQPAEKILGQKVGVMKKYNAGTLGVSAPVASGTLMASVAYRKGDITDTKDLKQMTGAIGYKYSLSKRTYLYTDVAYSELQLKETTKTKTKTTEFNVGICHNF